MVPGPFPRALFQQDNSIIIPAGDVIPGVGHTPSSRLRPLYTPPMWSACSTSSIGYFSPWCLPAEDRLSHRPEEDDIHLSRTRGTAREAMQSLVLDVTFSLIGIRIVFGSFRHLSVVVSLAFCVSC